jgi:hypothetical protein
MSYLRRFSVYGLTALAPAAIACCVASSGAPVQLSNEKVIIVWDEARHIQHFIREARFDTKAHDFGFIVPTPNVPNLGLAHPAAYADLEGLIPPPPRSKGHSTTSSGMPSSEMLGKVSVIRTETIGDYKATIVRATDGKAMNKWLKDNGYVSRPAMTDWLDYYAKQKWVFTAFKFMKKSPTGAWTQAIRVTFKTDVPRYPYKMPTDTWPEGHQRPMDLYFIAAGKSRAEYVGSTRPWEARVRWTGTMPDSLRPEFAKNIGLKEKDLPPKATVTVFQNGHNGDGYPKDLYFQVAPAQANDVPAPAYPWIACLGLLGAGATMAGRRARRFKA